MVIRIQTKLMKLTKKLTHWEIRKNMKDKYHY